jgi:serine protease Do
MLYVVHVKTYGTPTYNPFNDPFGGFFGNQSPRGGQQQTGSGSGVIVTSDGYIVTNNHVVSSTGDVAEKVEVTLNNNRAYTARVIGTDPSSDLALLKIDEKELPFIAYGNSDELKVGEWVLAVGNPFNLTSTVTAGIVSAKARNINILQGQNKIESYIQTDAAVNPGNSGGALVNTRGELVGINSAIASPTGSYSGYSFAIPVNIVRKVMDDLAEFGTVQRGFIGVSIRDVDSKLAQEIGLKEIKGIYVAGLTEGGAAKQAGIREGDVITKVGEVEVNSMPELQEQVGRFRPGDKVGVTVLRDNKEQLYLVTLRNNEGNTSIMKVSPAVNMLGGTFQEVTKDEKNNLGISSGVKVSKLNTGKLKAAGIREGFIITSIDHKAVRSTGDVEAALKDKQGGVLIEGVYPNGMRGYYGFGM